MTRKLAVSILALCAALGGAQAQTYRLNNLAPQSNGGALTPLPGSIGINGTTTPTPVVVAAPVPVLGLNPLAYGCKGDDATNDTACLQTAVNASATLGVPLYFDGAHLYRVLGSLVIASNVDLEGFAPVGNDGVSNAQTCLSGIDATNFNGNLLVATAPKVIIRNMCITMAAKGSVASAGAAILLGGADQQSDVISGNTIYRPYYGIELGGGPTFGASNNQTRNALVENNTVRDPGAIGITVGRQTYGGQTANITMRNNVVGCDNGASGTSAGFGFFDGSVSWDGTNVGPNNCAIGTEVIPGGASGQGQNVNGTFTGVLGDSSGSHNSGAQAYDLFIQPATQYGTVEWLSFTQAWAGSVQPTDTPVYIGNANSGTCSNIKFNGLTAHSGVSSGTTSLPIVDIEGCSNIVIAGSVIDAWHAGTTTYGINIAQGAGNPAHIAITGNHIGKESGATLTNGVTISGTGGGPAYITVTGNDLTEPATPINFAPSTNGQTVTFGDNTGVDDQCPSIASATSITIPASDSCVHLTGTTTVQNIVTAGSVGGWANRKITVIADSGLSLNTGGGTYGFCGGNNLSLNAAAPAFLQNNATASCWMLK